MPTAILKSVYAVSSEDPNHQGNNLLKLQSGKKWRTKDPGEKSAFVVLQLASPQKITGIDIGNEHSAFIEVLVGRTGCGPDDFKEIVITCSFMTPIESKNSTNVNRVRYFAKPALVQTVAEEKWDLVKIMCTQPFNKHVQYGISFVKVHILDEPSEKPANKSLVPDKFMPRKLSTDSKPPGTPQPFKLLAGKFRMRDEDSPDSESESSSALFKRWKDSRTAPKSDSPSTAAAIRAASSPAALKRDSHNLKPLKITKRASISRNCDEEEGTSVLDRNRNDLLFSTEDDIPNEKLERRITEDKERLKKASETPQRAKPKEIRPDDKTPLRSTSISNGSNENSAKKIKVVETTPKVTKKRVSSPPMHSAKKPKPADEMKPKTYKPFGELLQGVTLVISGIQNPDRANLRNFAIKLGAKYKADWDSSCTHLICAFKNTPKYIQVKNADGKIVKRSWIEDCYAKRMKIPWRRHALDSSEKDKPESEDEIFDLAEKKTEKKKEPQKPANDTTLAYYDLGDADEPNEQSQVISSGSDTEDEILKVQEKNKMKKASPKRIIPQEDDVFNVSTDEEEYTNRRKAHANNTLNFFQDKKFFLDSCIGAVEKMKIQNNILQFQGSLTRKLQNADYVISTELIAVPSSFEGEIVNPQWVNESAETEKLLPTKRYLLNKI